MAWLRRAVLCVLATLLLQVGAAWSGARVQVEAFDVEQVPHLGTGARLNFSVYGSSGATVTLAIEGAQRDLELREVQPGVYEGSYTVEEQDRIAPDARVTASLRIGDRSARAVLEEPLVLGAAAPAAREPEPEVATAPPVEPPPRPRPVPPPPRAPEERLCANCAVVESIQQVQGPDRRIRGDPIGRVLQILGDALEGRTLDDHKRTHYDVLLRRAGGARIVRTYDHPPPFKVGDTISLGVNLGGARVERPVAPPGSNWRSMSIDAGPSLRAQP